VRQAFFVRFSACLVVQIAATVLAGYKMRRRGKRLAEFVQTTLENRKDPSTEEIVLLLKWLVISPSDSSFAWRTAATPRLYDRPRTLIFLASLCMTLLFGLLTYAVRPRRADNRRHGRPQIRAAISS
jgi:hypothetical protein